MKVKGTITKIEEVEGEYGPYKIIHYKNETGNFKKPCYLKDVDVLLFDGNTVEFDLQDKGTYVGKDGKQHKNYKIVGIEQAWEPVSTVMSGGDSTTHPTESEKQPNYSIRQTALNCAIARNASQPVDDNTSIADLTRAMDYLHWLETLDIPVNFEQVKEVLSETKPNKK